MHKSRLLQTSLRKHNVPSAAKDIVPFMDVFVKHLLAIVGSDGEAEADLTD